MPSIRATPSVSPEHLKAAFLWVNGMNQHLTLHDKQITMSSLDLLKLVNQARASSDEKEVRHSDFVARCRDELDGDHYEIFVVQNSNSTTTEAINMTADQCKLVAMRESKAVRRAVLARLNELEADAAPRLPQSFAEALRLAADQQEQIEQQAAALAIAAPKVEFVDRYVDASGLKGFRQVAKLLRANEARFREFLADQQIMYRLGGEWVPYQQHIDAGRFEVKTGASDGGHAFNQAKFTPKGVNWIATLWQNVQGEME